MVCMEVAASWDREKSGKWSVIGQEKFKRLSTAYFLQREGKSSLDLFPDIMMMSKHAKYLLFRYRFMTYSIHIYT